MRFKQQQNSYSSVVSRRNNPCYPSPCNSNAFCNYNSSAAGGYTCRCYSGYIGNGTTCVNVCTSTNPCTRYNAYCTSDFYRRHRVCRCRYGFVNNGSESCQNPCDLNPCDKNAYCDRYKRQDQRCSCNSDFVGNGLECFRPPKCTGLGTSWSPFYNRDFPTGACDCETFADARVDYPKTICANPINVDVVDAVTYLDYRVNKQVVTVNTAREKEFIRYQQPKYKNLIPILVPCACVLGIGLVVFGVLFYRNYKSKRPSLQTEQIILQNVF
ncbi:uncharacterized protein LOC101242308 [Ciona intestinalis]